MPINTDDPGVKTVLDNMETIVASEGATSRGCVNRAGHRGAGYDFMDISISTVEVLPCPATIRRTEDATHFYARIDDFWVIGRETKVSNVGVSTFPME